MSFFFAAFLGSNTVKIEREMSEKIWAILLAREKIPTFAKFCRILIMLFVSAGQPSLISCEIPAGSACFISNQLSLMVMGRALNFWGNAVYSMLLPKIDRAKTANVPESVVGSNLRKIPRAKSVLIMAGIVFSNTVWLNISCF